MLNKRWLIAILYVLFIYATLGLVRGPVNFLRELGVLRLSLFLLYATTLITLVVALYKKRGRDINAYITFGFILLAYTALAQHCSSPEEQIHFIQYGLVGVLFYRALESNTLTHFQTLLRAFILASVAGFVDELIQGVLPSRHYDNWDIFLNSISSALGLGLYSLFPTLSYQKRKKTPKKVKKRRKK